MFDKDKVVIPASDENKPPPKDRDADLEGLADKDAAIKNSYVKRINAGTDILKKRYVNGLTAVRLAYWTMILVWFVILAVLVDGFVSRFTFPHAVVISTSIVSFFVMWGKFVGVMFALPKDEGESPKSSAPSLASNVSKAIPTPD